MGVCGTNRGIAGRGTVLPEARRKQSLSRLRGLAGPAEAGAGGDRRRCQPPPIGRVGTWMGRRGGKRVAGGNSPRGTARRSHKLADLVRVRGLKLRTTGFTLIPGRQ